MPAMTGVVSTQAQNIQQTLANTVAAIRINGDLTPTARVQKIAAAYTRASRDMAALQQTFTTTAQKTSFTAGRDVFGAMSSVGADAISARDADDRAQQLQSGPEALSLLGRAESNGDAVLARAIALRAYTMSQDRLFGAGWGPVVQAYLDTRPSAAVALEQYQAAQQNDGMTGLANAATFYLPVPSEIDRAVSSGTLAAYAGDDDGNAVGS